MSVSLWILSAIIILLMLGLGQRILDQLRLNDKQAIILLLAIAIGLIIPPIEIGLVSFSVGGFLIPLGITIYLLIMVGFSRDLLRAIIGTILTAGIIYGLEWVMPADPEELLISPSIIYGLVAGLVAYILGRSRRNAFICAVLGVSLSQLIQFIVNLSLGTPTKLGLGVGGAFSTLIIAILLSVALAEFMGRAFENATINKEIKKFNFETSTYDSVKNGRLRYKTSEIKTADAINMHEIKNANFTKND
ncbi:MAG: hypothetical protein IJT25_02250 [Clostridia bacterium]|nr:hypothetical protein [Clostridia bacterium]